MAYRNFGIWQRLRSKFFARNEAPTPFSANPWAARMGPIKIRKTPPNSHIDIPDQPF
jgi:hypothetical protein